MQRQGKIPAWVYDALLIVVLVIGAIFRFTGLNWDEDSYMHPDERFMEMTTQGLLPVSNLAAYFDTDTSTLNPNNRGAGFYVYGTYPMVLVKYTSEWIGQTGDHAIKTIGRVFSASFDLGTVFLAYLIAVRLYKRRTGLIAAGFSALAVLQIQQSHFFTVDNFANFFIFLAIYFAICLGTTSPDRESAVQDTAPGWRAWLVHPWFWPSVWFGLALGAAVASKLNAVPVTLMLPAAILLQISRHPRTEWVRLGQRAAVYLVLAAIASLLVFRILQPYAFSGPGFFGVGLNSKWVAAIQSQSTFSSRDVDYYPPAYQWARRPLWFSLQNMLLYGLGLPLGILAWAGFLWAGWRMLKGEFRRHILLWGWTGLYFAWQSLAFNATMRYQLPIYPALAIFAAWGLSNAWDAARSTSLLREASAQVVNRWVRLKRRVAWKHALVTVVSAGVILATLVWALAFTRIYTQPFTRVEASEWIYQNLPGPVNVRLQTPGGPTNQPLSFPYTQTIQFGTPYLTTFVSQYSGTLDEIFLAHVVAVVGAPSGALHASISSLAGGLSQPMAQASLQVTLRSPQDVSFKLPLPIAVSTGNNLFLNLLAPDSPAGLSLCSPVTLHIQTGSSETLQTIPPQADCTTKPGLPFTIPFQPQVDGVLQEVTFGQVSSPAPAAGAQSLLLIISSSPWQEQLLSTQALAAALPAASNAGQDSISFKLAGPVTITSGNDYLVRLWLDGSSGASPTGAVALQGTALANEGSWDDGLPLRIDGYDGFGGIYTPDLNFNMYDDDNPDKLARFDHILDTAEYIAISSNREWGSLTRLPERFPLTTLYYRDLLGCPPDEAITWCYSVAQPGMFTGRLGYELVKVVQSNPALGPLSINDQFAEEAFTVYDHPKVLIFKKTAAYNATQTHALLSAVDFSKIIPVKPGRAGSAPANLMLPIARWVQQMAGGTWSSLFNTDALLNKYPGIGLVLWYLTVMLLGLLVYPLVRLAFPGLSDRGYPLARIVGLLLLALMVWLAGSAGIPFSRLTISLALLVLAVVGVLLAYGQRDELRQEWKTKRRYFLMVEVIALLFFAIDLGIRLGNPDLWHPAYGGEKPMDFTILNAVLKSTTFPPYDAWFAGGYLNYYYYGDVVVGVLVKWLGIVPAVAYNLILPTLFSLLALGAFSAGWNLSRPSAASLPSPSGSPLPSPSARGQGEGADSILKNRQLWIGLAAASGMVLLGNLGTVRMIWQGLQTLAVPAQATTQADFFTRVGWSLQGFVKWLGGNHLPFSLGDWYWKPSRAIQPEAGNEITEFPFFSFLYADLHASTIALPIAAVAINWALSVFLGKGRWGEADGRHRWTSHALGLLVGAVVIGALRPTNTWDIFTYLPLGVVALAYATWRASPGQGAFSRRLMRVAIDVGLLAGLSILLYQPFSTWFGQAYTQIDAWHGNHTVIWSYLVHWGLFLFIIFSWLVWETLDWMASTPLSSLAKLRPYFGLILAGAAALLAAIFLLIVMNGVQIAWLPLLMGAWAAVLIFRPGMPDTKRAVLFLAGTALTLTLVVEVIVLHGDINRQNTVFKLYLQAWTLFAISAAAALGWLWQARPRWQIGWRAVWQAGMALLVGGTALCTVEMALHKIEDRMTPSAPITLDGMAFMKDAVYTDGIPNSGTATTMQLNLDLEAINWMQENVQGSPVIVEANIPIYHWGSRFSIYTGLPGVLGWDWHEIQQRALVPSTWITDRQADIQQFYLATDPAAALAFLQKYNVSYIIVGQYEHVWYPGPGLDKFAAQDGILWDKVYENPGTVIYKVRAP